MRYSNFEELFLGYIDGALDEATKRELEEAFETDAALRKSYDLYQEVVAHERRVARRVFEANPAFVVTVMRRVEKRGGFIERLSMMLAINRKVAASLLATTAVAVLVLRLGDESNWGGRVPKMNTRLERVNSVGEATSPVVPRPLGEQESMGGAKLTNEAKRVPLDSIQETPVFKSFRGEIIRQGDSVPVDGISAPPQYEQPSRLAPSAPVPNEALQGGRRVAESLSIDQSRTLGEQTLEMFEAGPGRFLPPASPSAERYIGQSDSPPVLVSHEAVSTFSIDVDTASYTNTRRFIQQGQLPPREAVRAEEFVNYFDYHYPVQQERPFTLSYEIAPSPITPGRALLKLGIKAKDVVDERKPWNLVFLIDTSGSMSDGNKLPLVKKALRVLVDKMRPDDKVAIVTYAGSSEVKIASTLGSNKAQIASVIESLSPGGGTYGSGGIHMAYSLAISNKAPGVNRVILVTDGDFNVGVTSHEELVRMIEQNRRSGVALTTVGVGEGNINDALLEQLADKGDGNYFYLDSFREARRIFEERIAGTIETVAKDVKLQMEFNPKNVVQYKLIGYENRMLAKQDFNNDAVDAGEVGAGHTVTALYELVLAGSTGAKGLVDASRYQQALVPQGFDSQGKFDGELGFLKIRFKAPEAENSQLVEFPVAMSDMRKDIEGTTPDFKFAAAIAGFAQSLRGALPAGVTMDTMIDLAEKGVGIDPKGERREAIDIMRSARALQVQFSQPVSSGSQYEQRYR